jgi:hypothetical protein
MQLATCGAIILGIGLIDAPAQAQETSPDIAQHMERIGAGSYVILSAGARTFTQVFRGPSGRYWVIDVIEGRDPNGTRTSREYRDSLGQMVRVENADGSIYSFAPNNCQHTMGTCQFIQTGPDGETPMVKQTLATPEGYSYQTFLFNGDGSPILADTATIMVDAMGSPMTGKITLQDGSIMQITQLQAVYHPANE